MLAFWLLALAFGVSVATYAQLVWHLGLGTSILVAFIAVIAVRGLASYVQRWLILHERIQDRADAEERTVQTNRYIFWRRLFWMGALLGIYFAIAVGFFGLTAADALAALPGVLFQVLVNVLQLFILLLANFLLFAGPFLLMVRMGRETLEPGDASYGVKIEDVRGQKSAVEEMNRILKLIEGGRHYLKAGGKRERGVLMVGPPGTGKTMLAKAIATSLKLPIIITSGSSFGAIFWGMDTVAVITCVRAAKKKAKRWGGCLIFIDEFDALGSRRAGMGGGGMGGMGGLMGGGGQGGLNTLLVQMDGVDNPGFIRKAIRRSINVTLDGLFIPRRIGFNSHGIPLRVPQIRPTSGNLLFLGATNRPQVLDEAVTRPGRFGRTITFRSPTREDRKDIAQLYFGTKKHVAELDTPGRRDEFARVTEGYSPAMIEQALSLALMYAFEDGRDAFNWRDLREAMGNIETGLVEPVEYTDRDKIAVARHELGHALAAKFFLPDAVSVRLSIRMRSGSLGHHRAVEKEEEFSKFRSQLAGELRHTLGAIASERVFYGENSSGVSMDLIQATNLASRMVGVYGMGPDTLDPQLSRKALGLGEYLVSRVELTTPALAGGSIPTAVLENRNSRRTVAQVLGAAYIDAWRVMYVNKEAIDLAAEALMAQGELVGDEIGGLLDSIGLKSPTPADPYPEDMPQLPVLEQEPAAARSA